MQTAVWSVLSAIVLCGGITGAARANDSFVEGASGTVRRMGGEHKSVRMVRETVRLDLYPDYYETVADFTFANDGPALTVKMGFPEWGGGDAGKPAAGGRKTGGFLKFATSVDGQPVAARRLVTKQDDIEGYEAFWVKQVPFRSGQTRRVQVRYRSPYGLYATPTLARSVSYSFTGGNWRGTVDESRLVVTLHEPGSFVVAPKFENDKGDRRPLTGMAIQGATLARTWRDWQAEGVFSLSLAKAPPGWLAAKGEETANNRFQGAPLTTLRVPGKVTDANLGYDYLPNAMQADGITWLKLSMAPYTLEPVLKARNPAFVPDMTKEYRHPARTASVRLGRQNFVFTMGQKTMTVDGKTVSLPLPPRRVRPRQAGDNRMEVYVPLAPVLKVLGGEAMVQSDQHRFVVRPVQVAKG